MQITDQQFIDAMQKAVEVKGCDNVAPGRYRGYGGAPSCIIGMALAQISEELVPWDNRLLAHALVTSYGCSERVAVAAHWAQYANDCDIPWGDVKFVFDKALTLFDRGYSRLIFEQMMLGITAEVREKAREAWRVKRAQEALQNAKAPKNFASIGVIETGNFDALLKEMKNLNAAIQKMALPKIAELGKVNVTVNPSLTAIGIEPPHVKTAFSLVS